MNFFQSLTTLATKAVPTAEAVGQIILDVEIDHDALAAGTAVTLPKIQVASIGGKAVYLEGQLSLT